ncbi:MAG: pyruvate formate lyase family protein [Lachnospirales bacterium]
MLKENKVVISEDIHKKIKNLHSDKIEINNAKIKTRGSIDIDDHGFILFPEFKFEPVDLNEDGKIVGMKSISKNFRKFLNEMPKYINKNSALATCWVGQINDFVPIGFNDNDVPHHLDPIIEKYHILQPGFGAMNHLAPDIKIGLELGWQGLIDKIDSYKEKLSPADSTFFDGEKELVLGIIEWIGAHVELARNLAKDETDPEAKNNYFEIAKINENLMIKPPSNFREACQFIAHFQSIDRTYFAGGALCQLDEDLYPYYINDVEKNNLKEDEALWYIASLFFNDTHYSQIGGLIPDGTKDKTNRLTFIILDAMHTLNIPTNIALRVSDKVNKTLIERAIQYTIEDGSGVDYSCNIGCEDGYARNGYPLKLARLRAKVGCNWTALPGIEYPLQDVCRCNMSSAFVEAFKDLEEEKNPTLEKLWDKFVHHTKIMIDCIKENYDWHYEVISRNRPEIVLNLFMHGPIERGLNCAEGGVDIINFNIDGIALATVADSFAAIEERVVNEGLITWEELFHCINTNYEGKEDIRLMLKNIKRFGNPDSLGENWAIKIKDFYVDYCNRPTPKHQIKIIPGMFSHGDVYMYGKHVTATPNGRKSFEPISHSNDPDPGFAVGINSFSPTLKASAVAKTQPGFGNSSPLHLDIDNNTLTNEGGVPALVALIHTHNQMGGTLINLNCMTKKKLMEAHKDPSKHPDLVVRVTGYSAFFSSLSREYRQQIVDRFLD